VKEEINLFKMVNSILVYHPEWFLVYASRKFQNTNNTTALLSMSFMSFHLVSTIDMQVPSHNNDLFVCNTKMLSNNK